jgi:hypothetical protein
VAAVTVVAAVNAAAVAATAASKPRSDLSLQKPDTRPAFSFLAHRPPTAYRAYKKRRDHAGSGSGVGRYSPKSV